MHSRFRHLVVFSVLAGCSSAESAEAPGTDATTGDDASTDDASTDGTAASDVPSIPDALADGTPADGVVADAVTIDEGTPETPAPPPPGPSGFWRIDRPAGSARTWLLAPNGDKVFGLGVNTVMRDRQCDGIDDYIRRAAPSVTANTEWARMSSGSSGGQTVAKPYCFNSVGAFSDTNDFESSGAAGDSWMIRPTASGGAGAPYGVVVSVSPRGTDRALKNDSGTVIDAGISGTAIGDPFNPAFAADIDAMIAADVTPRRSDAALQMWFLGNEIGIFDGGAKTANGGGVRDFRRWLWSDCPTGSTIDAPKCASHALAAFLREKYATVAKLNAAWGTAHADFVLTGTKRPVPYVHDCEQTCRTDLQVFVHDRLLRTWVRMITQKVRAADPNHIVSTPRLALGTSNNYRFWQPASKPNPDTWTDSPANQVGTDTATVKYCPFDLLARDGAAGFDVISVNVYSGDSTFETPWFTDGIHKLQNLSGLPVYVSEFGIRARIDGWSNRGGAGSFVPYNDGTSDQIQRGAYYRSQVEQFLSFRNIIGASWHAWSDRYLAADDAHQINMGLIRCRAPGMTAGARWDEVDDRVAETNCNVMKSIEAKTGL